MKTLKIDVYFITFSLLAAVHFSWIYQEVSIPARHAAVMMISIVVKLSCTTLCNPNMGITFLSVTNRECPKVDLKLMTKSHWLLHCKNEYALSNQ